MSGRQVQLVAARRLRHSRFVLDEVTVVLRAEVASWATGPKSQNEAWAGIARLLSTVPRGTEVTVQRWWDQLEPELLPSPPHDHGTRWPAAVRALVTGRLVQPSWKVMASVAVQSWIYRLPADDPLVIAHDQLREIYGRLSWPAEQGIRRGASAGLRMMLVNDYDRLNQIVEADMDSIPTGGPVGADMLDIALCAAGIFVRSPRRGTSRRRAKPPRTVEQLVALRNPSPFDEVTIAHVTAYQQRVSQNYNTICKKVRSLSYFWQYMGEEHPDITACSMILPHHTRGFVSWALTKARAAQRGTDRNGAEDRTTTYDWFVDVRTFFADLCSWATEPGLTAERIHATHG